MPTDGPVPAIPPNSGLDRLLDLLTMAGYEHAEVEETPDEDHGRVYELTYGQRTTTPHDLGSSPDDIVYFWSVTLGEGIGYYRFICVFYFAESGELINHGVWE